MICKNCETEHPVVKEGNPFYCIARLEDKIERLEAELAQVSHQNEAAQEGFNRLINEREALRDGLRRVLDMDFANRDPEGWEEACNQATALLEEKSCKSTL